MFGGVVERLSDPAVCPIRSMTTLRIEGGVGKPMPPFLPILRTNPTNRICRSFCFFSS